MEDYIWKGWNMFRGVMNISIHSGNLFLFLFLGYVLLSTSRNPELASMRSAKDSFHVRKSLNEDLC